MAERETGQERERPRARGAERFAQLAEHARKTEGLIPMIVLTPIVGA